MRGVAAILHGGSIAFRPVFPVRSGQNPISVFCMDSISDSVDTWTIWNISSSRWGGGKGERRRKRRKRAGEMVENGRKLRLGFEKVWRWLQWIADFCNLIAFAPSLRIDQKMATSGWWSASKLTQFSGGNSPPGGKMRVSILRDNKSRRSSATCFFLYYFGNDFSSEFISLSWFLGCRCRHFVCFFMARMDGWILWGFFEDDCWIAIAIQIFNSRVEWMATVGYLG